MSYKPGFYEPKKQKGSGKVTDQSQQEAEAVKSSCPVKKFMVLGLITMIGILIMQAVKED